MVIFLNKREGNTFSFNNMLNLLWQALGLRRDDTFSVTMLGHCIEMYIGDSEAYIGKMIIILIGIVLHFLGCYMSLFMFLIFSLRFQFYLSNHSCCIENNKLHLFYWNNAVGS